MKHSETLLWIAFFGTKHEADDIIEYLAIWSALLISLLLAAGLAIGVGKFAGVWGGLIAGLAVYCASMRICLIVFRRQQANR